jgi:hypothetical protein
VTKHRVIQRMIGLECEKADDDRIQNAIPQTRDILTVRSQIEIQMRCPNGCKLIVTILSEILIVSLRIIATSSRGSNRFPRHGTSRITQHLVPLKIPTFNHHIPDKV